MGTDREGWCEKEKCCFKMSAIRAYLYADETIQYERLMMQESGDNQNNEILKQKGKMGFHIAGGKKRPLIRKEPLPSQ